MNTPEHVKLIARYLTDTISEKEEITLNEWLNESEKHPKVFVEYYNIWEEAKKIGQDFEPNVEKALQLFLNKITPSEPVSSLVISPESTTITKESIPETTDIPLIETTIPESKTTPSTAIPEKPSSSSTVTNKKSSPIKKWLKWTAVLGFICAVFYWSKDNVRITSNMVTLQTGNEVKSITLPDSTMVWLNKYSTLIYDKSMKTRDIELHGEAYFDVPNMPENEFKIHCNDAEIVAGGENFGVRSYDEEDLVEVAIKEGKGTLEAASVVGKNTVKGQSGFKMSYKKSKKMLQTQENENPTQWAWKEGKLEFHGQALRSVFETIERYYKVEIKLSHHNIGKCIYSKTFEKMEVQPLLEIIAKDKKLKLKQTETGFLISGNGCGTRTVDQY